MKRSSGTQLILAFCLVTTILATSPVVGQSTSTSATVTVPRLVKFSGVVKDAQAKPTTGVVGITFALYKDQEGGAPLWLETQNVRADANGHYTVMLGSTKPDGLPMEFFTSNEARWVGVQPQGQAEQPRVLLVSAPYALKAADAETLGGKPLSAFQLVTPQSSNSSTQKTSPAAEQPNEIRCAGGGACKTSFLPKFSTSGGSATVNNSIISQSGTTVGIAGSENVTGNVGIGSAPSSFQLQVTAPNQFGTAIQGPFSGVGAGLDLDTTGSGGKGWELLATGKTAAQGPNKLNIRDLSTGTDVFTIAPGGLVGIGTVNPGAIVQVTDAKNPNFIAVVAADLSNSSPGAAALFGDATATSGTTHGVFGQIFSSSTGASAVEGEAQASSGQTYGVQGFNVSTGNFSAGVSAVSSPGSGITFGALAISNSPNGTGTLGLGEGESSTGIGILGCCPLGVWGDTGSSAPGAAGLVGTADDARAIYLQNNSPSGVPTAFMFQGASGQLALQAGGGGGFCTVDDNGHLSCAHALSVMAPVQAGRHVALYAMQSPQNWFEDFGSERLANGAASVNLEHTFAQTVNAASDYHVFLTPEGDCRGLYVSNKTATGFEVHELGGGQSNVTFAYRIVALRRGFENVRLQDMTERWKKMNAPLPKVVPGRRVTLPAPPHAPAMPVKFPIAAAAKLTAQR